MKRFKNGDYVIVKNLDKSVIDAVIERFEADGVACNLTGIDFQYVSYIRIHKSALLVGAGTYEGNELTPEQVLFAGAPENTNEVKCAAGKHYYWFNSLTGDYKMFTGEEGSTVLSQNDATIYTRTTEQRKTVADAVDAYGGEWPFKGNEIWRDYVNPGAKYYTVLSTTDEGYLVCTREEFQAEVKRRESMKEFGKPMTILSQDIDASSMHFHFKNEECGKLSWRNGIFAFEGDAEKSAESFLKVLDSKNAKTSKDSDWYDYEKQEAISLPNSFIDSRRLTSA